MQVLRRPPASWFALCFACLLAGCALPYATPRLEPDNVPFIGIKHALSAKQPPDVLLVHGMCTHVEFDLQTAIAELGAAMSMKPDRAQDVVLNRVWGEGGDARLYSVELRDGTRSVRAYALLWSPIVTAYKRARICYDVSSPSKSCDGEAGFDKERGSINAALKNGLLDDCLADATFYLGATGRDLLSAAAQRALLTVFGGGRDPMTDRAAALQAAAQGEAPFFLVTHSLGSKITADALQQLPDSAVTSALGRTYQVFMQANQLPMLTLGASPLVASASAAAGTVAGAVADPAVQQMIDRIVDARRRRAALLPLAEFPLVIVAFNDPNDPLTWGLTRSSVRFAGTQIVDASVSNAPTLLWTFENPWTAHTGYAANKAVARLIACGWKWSPPVDGCP